MPTAATPLAAPPVIPMTTAGQPAPYAPPPFLVPPPQFIPAQTAPPSIINYVPAPNGPGFQPNFQGYPGYNPTVPVRRFSFFCTQLIVKTLLTILFLFFNIF